MKQWKANWILGKAADRGRQCSQVQDFPEAARSYYALAAKTQADDANEKGLAG